MLLTYRMYPTFDILSSEGSSCKSGLATKTFNLNLVEYPAIESWTAELLRHIDSDWPPGINSVIDQYCNEELFSGVTDLFYCVDANEKTSSLNTTLLMEICKSVDDYLESTHVHLILRYDLEDN